MVNKRRLTHWHGFVLSLLTVAILSGCQNRSRAAPDPNALPTRVAGSSDSLVMSLQADLRKRGIKVITIGQDYLISIPSTMLFPNQSPALTWESYSVLNDVIRFIQQFRKVGVNITAYSSKYVSVRRERSLTMKRARVVADYLWSQDIDSRFVFTDGAGSDKPIMLFSPTGDKSPNSRIEITFRDAIV